MIRSMVGLIPLVRFGKASLDRGIGAARAVLN